MTLVNPVRARLVNIVGVNLILNFWCLVSIKTSVNGRVESLTKACRCPPRFNGSTLFSRQFAVCRVVVGLVTLIPPILVVRVKRPKLRSLIIGIIVISNLFPLSVVSSAPNIRVGLNVSPLVVLSLHDVVPGLRLQSRM